MVVLVYRPPSDVEEDESYSVMEMDFHQGYARPRIKAEADEEFLATLEIPDYIQDALTQIRKNVLQRLEERLA